jgi:predicted metal-dependent hydrolase
MTPWWTFDDAGSSPKDLGESWPPAFEGSSYISLRGRVLPYRRIAHPRARHLKVVVSPDDGILVRARRRPSERLAGQALVELADWVLAQVRRLERRPRGPSLRPVEGRALPWLGRSFVVRRTSGKTGQVRLRAATGEVWIPAPPADPTALSASLEIYGRKEARARLSACIDRWSARTGLRPQRLRIGDPKSRWASCSSRGTLSFSWRIMALDDELVDYLVCHELAHLRHAHHGPEFWSLLESWVPQARALDRKLNQVGTLR